MIVCVGCGHANGGQDTFCGSCGGFLEWDGQQVAPTPARLPVPVPEPRDGGAPPRPPEPEHVRPAPSRPDPVDLGPADLYCGGCGAGNAGARHFCRRCGAPLADATPAPRVGWWRRLRERLSRRRELVAGQRPASWDGGKRLGRAGAGDATPGRRRWRRPRMPMRLSLGKLALPLAVLSLVGFGIAPLRSHVTGALFGGYHYVRVRVAPNYVPVLPSGASASSALPGHGAAAAVDGNLLTWWSEGARGRGHGQRLVVRFDRPTDLARMTFHNGAAGAAYPFQPRLRAVRIKLIGADGVLQERRVPLADDDAQQAVVVKGHGVTQVVVRVLATYAGQRSAAASLAEVGFLAAE